MVEISTESMNRTVPAPLEVRPDPEQAGLGRDQRVLQLRGPRRVGEVTGAEHGQALAQRPPGQVLDVAVLAARAREPRVDMQIGVEHVGPIVPRATVIRGANGPHRGCGVLTVPSCWLREDVAGGL